MGWLRSVGSIKWKVSFAEYSLIYSALLQNRPVILSILLTKAPPYLPREYKRICLYRFNICIYVHWYVIICILKCVGVLVNILRYIYIECQFMYVEVYGVHVNTLIFTRLPWHWVHIWIHIYTHDICIYGTKSFLEFD